MSCVEQGSEELHQRPMQLLLLEVGCRAHSPGKCLHCLQAAELLGGTAGACPSERLILLPLEHEELRERGGNVGGRACCTACVAHGREKGRHQPHVE